MKFDLFQDWPFGNLELHSFGVVLIDPPWLFKLRSAAGEAKSPQAHYDCMKLPQIKAMPISALCKPDAVCVCWATAPMLDLGIETLKGWGFTFKTAGAWAKQSSTGQKWAFGPGYIMRSAAEFYLIGTRGDPKTKNRSTRNLLVAPVREHSRKPDKMRSDIEALWPGPYVEIFARETAPGWSVWGNQTKKFNGSVAA